MEETFLSPRRSNNAHITLTEKVKIRNANVSNSSTHPEMDVM